MLCNEVRPNNINISLKNIQRIKTQKSLQETDAISPSAIPEINKNQFSLINNFIPEQEGSYGNTKNILNKGVSLSNEENNKSKSEKRVDRFGNNISPKGKQKISFIDKITKNKLVDIINIESYKQYNKMEEVSYCNNHNNCCFLI